MMIKKSQSKGFTLVEILLTMLIIVFFTGLTLVNYKSGGKYLALQRSANQLSQDLRKAEQKAMSTTKCEECGVPAIIPEGGYGIYFEEGTTNGKKYILYADRDGAGIYDFGDTQVGGDILIESGVYIDKIEIIKNSVSSFPSDASVNFQAPEPLIIISNGVSGGDKVIITLALESDPAKTVTVEVNTAGLVEIK